MDNLLTPAEVAERVPPPKGPVTSGTARQWMADGKVPGSFPLGATYVITEADLNTAIEKNRIGKRADPGENGPPFLTSYATVGKLASAGISVSHVTVLDWLRRGILPGQKVGKAWAVERAALERAIAEGIETPKRGRPSNDEG